MAQFSMELPDEIAKQFEMLYQNTDKMCKEMTKSGAKVVKKNVDKAVDGAFKDAGNLKKCLKITKAYKNANGDIGTKVAFYGYFVNKKGKTVPAPLVAQAREYGTSRGEAAKPFMFQSFNDPAIEQAMHEVEDKYLPKE